MEKSNARRFLDAYNTIDQSLRVQFNYKRSMGFSDMIRMSVPVNYIVRRYEDKLVDYGRLRNAIIHKSSDEFIIAEPHDDVVADLEKIAKLIATPPTALKAVSKNRVLTANANETVENIIKLMASSTFSNIPIYLENELMGVANGQKILNVLGNEIIKGKNISEFIKDMKIKDILDVDYKPYSYFEVASSDSTIEKVLGMFDKNRKLYIILITKTGSKNELPLGIITAGDIIELNRIIENY
ncbi:MAG: CBS domain-containing protein [Clostridia bacterium]